MTEARRVGVLGGTFDPIHIGHLAAAQDTADQLGLDRVLFIPNRVPPHKRHSQVSDVEDRLAMLDLSLDGNPLFEVSRVELERPGPSYTLDTMRQLRSIYGPEADLFFLTGCDSLRDLHGWHQPDELLAEFRLVVMDRPPEGRFPWPEVEARFPDIRRQVIFVHIPLLQISSRDLRRRVAENRSIRYYVPRQVEEYIRERGLYA